MTKHPNIVFKAIGGIIVIFRLQIKNEVHGRRTLWI
jgi:hypothetical protein